MMDHVSPIHRVMAVEDILLIRTRLQTLRKDHPQLDSLVKSIPNDCSITQEFLTAHFESTLPSAEKNLVLRALLGDPSIYPRGAASPVGLDYYRRAVQYFEHHPQKPLIKLTGDFQKEDIPRYLEKITGISRRSPRTFLSQFGLIPYLLFRRGHLPPQGYRGIRINRSNDLSFLRPFYISRKITKAICEELLTEGATHYAYATYFDTGDKALDLHNMLIFLRVYWQKDQFGEKIQNKIPKAICSYFGLSRLSKSELAFLVDILPLIHLGTISRSELSSQADSLQLLPLLKGIKDSRIDNLETLISSQAYHWLLNSEKAELIFCNREKGSRQSITEGGLYFNMQQLLSKSTGTRFASYYSAVNDMRLKRQINAYYRNMAPAFTDQLLNVQQQFDSEFRGIRIRDLSNILFYVWHQTKLGRDRRKILPAAAKQALRVMEHEVETSQSGENERKTGTPSISTHSEARSHLLDAFCSALSKCYLLHPGYTGPIPDDGPVYLPRTIATNYIGLPQFVIQIGPKRLTWGENPYDLSHLADIMGYESIIPLRNANEIA